MRLFDFFKGGKKGSSGGSSVKLPEFFQDKYYEPTQDYLFDFGKDILAGDLNDYYRPIGEFGGSEFDKFMATVVRDTTRASEEDAVRRGAGRGGLAAALTAKNVADVSSKYGYADYERAMQGREGLMKLGTGVTEGVRQAGLTNQAQRNNFNLGVTKLALNKEKQDYAIADANAGAQGNWLDSIFTAGADLFDMFSGGGADGGLNPQAVESLVSGGGKMGSAKGDDDWLDWILKAGGALAGTYFGGPAGGQIGYKAGDMLGDQF